ncbi:unnamed protein product [Cyclocybe aegerita]|uniref:Uncharacterized protein n=1 Tax=Cyclocybe aegerita TaxID=1973307 RepID=A0A8S0VZI2_CYCAE|nr:unnamed protein product [Cyclocybe aegerita]
MTDDPASILTPHLPISAMDEHYDINAAKTSLEKMSKERMPNHLQLCKFDMEEGLHHFVQPTYTEYPRCWKLTYLDNDGGIEEVVLQVQGIITGSAMPPIKWPFKIIMVFTDSMGSAHRVVDPSVHSGQAFSLSVCRALQEWFEADDLRRITFVYVPSALRWDIHGSLELWNASSSAGYLTIDMVNHYFTPRSQASPDQIISFSFAIDPDGILAACTTDGTLVHTEDNSVEYYERYQEGEKQRYEAINPIKFRIGDIAEAQVSFIVIRLKEQKYKMLIVMRALTLLDSSPLRRCWKWGHPTVACKAKQLSCPICSGPHEQKEHRQHAGCCKGNAKAKPPVPPTPRDQPCPHKGRCVNCHKDHAANSASCKFWAHCYDREWIMAEYRQTNVGKPAGSK